MLPLRLILVDPDPLLCKAWHTAFADLPNVAIVNGYFEQLPVFDCMVSAANSFGLMDGGVDAAIVRFFGVQLESRVQQRVAEEYLGEQPVGTSIIVETGHPQHPFMPTHQRCVYQWRSPPPRTPISPCGGCSWPFTAIIAPPISRL